MTAFFYFPRFTAVTHECFPAHTTTEQHIILVDYCYQVWRLIQYLFHAHELRARALSGDQTIVTLHLNYSFCVIDHCAVNLSTKRKYDDLIFLGTTNIAVHGEHVIISHRQFASPNFYLVTFRTRRRPTASYGY